MYWKIKIWHQYSDYSVSAAVWSLQNFVGLVMQHLWILWPSSGQGAGGDLQFYLNIFSSFLRLHCCSEVDKFSPGSSWSITVPEFFKYSQVFLTEEKPLTGWLTLLNVLASFVGLSQRGHWILWTFFSRLLSLVKQTAVEESWNSFKPLELYLQICLWDSDIISCLTSERQVSLSKSCAVSRVYHKQTPVNL